MIGRLLEITGGAQVLADTLIGRFGEKRAPFALGVAALLFGFPIFFDAGLVVFLPIIMTVARRFGGSILLYAFPAAGAFAAMHALVPPAPRSGGRGRTARRQHRSHPARRRPGRRRVLVRRCIPGVPGDRRRGSTSTSRPRCSVRSTVAATAATPARTAHPGEPAPASPPGPPPPSHGARRAAAAVRADLVQHRARHPDDRRCDRGGRHLGGATSSCSERRSIALLITVHRGDSSSWACVARSMADVSDILDNALGPICAIILITGAGGMFGGVLRLSGIGDALERLAVEPRYLADPAGVPHRHRCCASRRARPPSR